MAFLTQLASLIINKSFLTGIFFNPDNWPTGEKWGWLGGVVEFIDSAFVPILIILGAVGGVWCIFLGVNLARAETADKADEAKKRLINVIIAVIASALLIFLLALFVANIPNIFGE
ncbi:MAG: hypothetical protein LBN07_04150 [Christensenellaceae bacterium]|jgi:hypothetical protein|nr:hypothetical protein [Christensenellaceae bacterium]